VDAGFGPGQLRVQLDGDAKVEFQRWRGKEEIGIREMIERAFGEFFYAS
jgi:hypothetical protein